MTSHSSPSAETGAMKAFFKVLRDKGAPLPFTKDAQEAIQAYLAALPAPTQIKAGETELTDEKLGEFIYRVMYERQGGLWRAVETRDVWYEKAAQLRALLAGDGRTIR